ncbi:hypothetical protein F0562_028638 [Nyssa sinensis]|uniref:Uncharacterized protein n=1 Tax=Nyssa sinensis TaxID=561372 RepID=A0A5J5B0V1_9ASTE|nr:hypothetical protein F0562_028638 [Nyssa sinensis]
MGKQKAQETADGLPGDADHKRPRLLDDKNLSKPSSSSSSIPHPPLSEHTDGAGSAYLVSMQPGAEHFYNESFPTTRSIQSGSGAYSQEPLRNLSGSYEQLVHPPPSNWGPPGTTPNAAASWILPVYWYLQPQACIAPTPCYGGYPAQVARYGPGPPPIATAQAEYGTAPTYMGPPPALPAGQGQVDFYQSALPAGHGGQQPVQVSPLASHLDYEQGGYLPHPAPAPANYAPGTIPSASRQPLSQPQPKPKAGQHS